MRAHRPATLYAALLFAAPAAAIAATLALAPRTARAAPDPGAVQGTLRGPDQKPLEMVDVMLLPGDRRLPPFIIRPKAFGLPLPNVRVARTDAQGRFFFPRAPEGRSTLAIGQEGLLLFGTVATRSVEPGQTARIRLRADEMARFHDLADRAERATEVLEDVLVEVDSALGWYVETRGRLETAADDLQAWLGCAPDGEEEGAAKVRADGGRAACARALFQRLRRRVEEGLARRGR